MDRIWPGDSDVWLQFSDSGGENVEHEMFCPRGVFGNGLPAVVQSDDGGDSGDFLCNRLDPVSEREGL